MKTSRVGLALLPWLLVPLIVEAQTPTFRSGVITVPMYVTAVDSQRRLIPDLVKEDFEILDNNVLQEITVFQNEPLPVSVAVMLDTSASMTLNIDLLKRATEQFLIRLLPADKARVGAFNDKLQFSGDFSNNRDDLVGALSDLDFGNATRLYDAINFSIEALKEVEGRKVVLVFTDGDDTASRTSFNQLIERAREDEIMIYAIGLESVMTFGGRQTRTRADRGLKKLADETGGGYFELKHTDDLGPTFSRVAQELHSQYVLGFTPTVTDGKVHKLDLRVKRPGVTGRARRTYQAPPSATASANPSGTAKP
jgi:Ca-activated chloride channel family protein